MSSLESIQPLSWPMSVGWRLGVLVKTDDSSLLNSNPMQLLRVTSGSTRPPHYCLSVCRQTSLGTYRFSNEYNSVQCVGDNIRSIDSGRLQFPTVIKAAAQDHPPPDSLDQIKVEQVYIGLVHSQQPDILLTSEALIRSLNCFDREPVWYRPSSAPVDLERVVIAVDCGHSREEARRVVSRLYELGRRGPLILHQDFDFTVGFETEPNVGLSVLETFPTLQGVVSERTAIAVLPSIPLCPDFQESFEERPRAQSASNFDLVGPLDKEEYIIEVITTDNFPLQNHFVVLPAATAQQHNIQHCQNIWVSPTNTPSKGSITKRKQSVIPLDGGDSSRSNHKHMAIALLYENTQELEKYIPPMQFGQRYMDYSDGLAYVHSELLYYLFPETLSPSKTFKISIEVRWPQHCMVHLGVCSCLFTFLSSALFSVAR